MSYNKILYKSFPITEYLNEFSFIPGDVILLRNGVKLKAWEEEPGELCTRCGKSCYFNKVENRPKGSTIRSSCPTNCTDSLTLADDTGYLWLEEPKNAQVTPVTYFQTYRT